MKATKVDNDFILIDNRIIRKSNIIEVFEDYKIQELTQIVLKTGNVLTTDKTIEEVYELLQDKHILEVEDKENSICSSKECIKKRKSFYKGMGLNIPQQTNIPPKPPKYKKTNKECKEQKDKIVGVDLSIGGSKLVYETIPFKKQEQNLIDNIINKVLKSEHEYVEFNGSNIRYKYIYKLLDGVTLMTQESIEDIQKKSINSINIYIDGKIIYIDSPPL